jgi:hypothetical protein
MNRISKWGVVVGGMTLAAVSVLPAAAAGGKITNSTHSDQSVGVWQHSSHCSGPPFVLVRGKYATGVDSVKSYAEHGTAIFPNGHRMKLTKRHCYTVGKKKGQVQPGSTIKAQGS